ncbi:hypothetical protein C2S53_014389 [Perilla frutescens var. hirtella]|uniref:Uncharacterized protein n=1 Tax=Perilla frutescens var. hirtella TaxID=608512 RepID=A0AAD4JGT8_PERFH|nr:hypothetical protein C2S53_014389 [Perilla frutescens var. hirtella]
MSSMLSIRKFFRCKLRSSFEKEGQQGKDYTSVNTMINEEYREAFRTKSYTEICNKIQGQIQTRISLDHDQEHANSSPSSPPPPPTTTEQVHLSEYLVEPHAYNSTSKTHHFLIKNYLKTSQEASKICEFLLQNTHQLRLDYHAMKKVITFIEKKPDSKIWSHNQRSMICRNLASSFPLSSITQEKFHELHDIHHNLFHQLTSKCKKTKRKKKFTRWIKRGMAILGCAALAAALLLLAMHSVVGVAATAPGLIAASFVMKKLRRGRGGSREGRMLLETQLDEAAKGMYVVINDFDTMRRLVERLREEMEHRKSAAETCVRRGRKGAVEQVVRDFQMHEDCFMEQVEELEKQIYLCFLHINRSRRQLN